MILIHIFPPSHKTRQSVSKCLVRLRKKLKKDSFSLPFCFFVRFHSVARLWKNYHRSELDVLGVALDWTKWKKRNTGRKVDVDNCLWLATMIFSFHSSDARLNVFPNERINEWKKSLPCLPCLKLKQIKARWSKHSRKRTTTFASRQ